MIKKFYSFMLAAAALMAYATAQADQVSISVGGQNRVYYDYTPANLGENRPLLISMHGMNQDAGYQRGMLQIENIADTAKFVTVFPEGIDRGWDIGGTRDINFVLAIIDNEVARHKIDRNRVYLSGFSMGGMFTYHAMNHIADKIAAFAPISGYPMGGQPFTSARPVPIIHTHGTGDDVVTFDNVHARLSGWIERNGCSQTALVTNSYRNNGGATRHEWGPGIEGAEVVLLELANKGHWISNDGFYTGEEIWNFCKRYALNQPLPTVTIGEPTLDTEYSVFDNRSGIESLKITVNASTKTSTIAAVNVYGDGELVASLTEAPYECEWNNVARGWHVIKAVAIDADGVQCGRACPVNVKLLKKNLTLSADFKDAYTMPAGWMAYDGKKLVKSPATGLTSGPRTMAFTGQTRAFDYGLYLVNVNGKEDKGYGVYGDARMGKRLLLSPGKYELDFDACNYETAGSVRCAVVNFATSEVIASAECMPTVVIGGSTSNSFSDASHLKLPFSVDEEVPVKVMFYTANQTGADAVVANIKLVHTSTQGIEAVEAAEAAEASVEYYDLAGRRAGSDAKGLLLRRAVLVDGSVKTEKVVR